MSTMLCTGATFVKKNSCLVAKIVSFDTVKSSNLIFLNSEFFFFLTFGFIASARAFNLPTRAFNLAIRAFSLTRGSEFVTCGFELVTLNS